MTVEQIRIRTGGPEGFNSAYVLPERGLLIDPGPPGEESWNQLRRGLRNAGVALDDVVHVVVTHWHVDHAGLAPRIAETADAQIHMHERDAPLLATYARERERRYHRDATTLEAWGVPAERVTDVHAADIPSALPDKTVVETHVEGDTVAGTTVIHTPGHTAGHLALSVDGHVFVGDTVLPTYTPNVGGSDTRLANPLASFLRSINRLERADGVLHPGHGSQLDTPKRLKTIRNHHQGRSQRVFNWVRRLNRPTPWDIAKELFGEMQGIHIKFGAGEAAAHLEYLVQNDIIATISTDPLRFELRQGADEDTVSTIFE
ncbi:MBL fold metallo-hydrolase [Natrinema soli]|uniref:MBL fold metallo-hydrolase n=1 Tax=Natrinema soli TaxID=1930624 RepID=A0ABD5SSV4_9EURY|nr:MBL fold metallo-hydrolase [Natrinema soli]